MGSAKAERFGKIKDSLNYKRVLAIGASVVALGAAIIYDGYDRSGEVTSYGPVSKGPELIDDKLRVLNWNMHNETSSKFGKIEEIVEKYDVDAVALQEVSAEDAEGLHKYFPNAYIKFAMADAKTKLLEGGYGNVLMTFQEQSHTRSIPLDGNKFPAAVIQLATGAVADAKDLDASLKNTKDATQEDRSALASTILVQQGESLSPVRIITGHIGAPRSQEEVHEKQFSDLREFIRESVEGDQGAIFCGDLNLSPQEVIPSYLRMGFYAHQTKNTTPKGLTPDYCAYHPGDVLGEGEVRVLGNQTDHYALLGTWKTTP